MKTFAIMISLGSLAWLDPVLGAAASRPYENKWTPILRPQPLLADHPHWVEPIRETNRWEAPAIVDEPEADLHVRAWRWSYNARGIIEIPNHLQARRTAVVMVHPWGIDDGQRMLLELGFTWVSCKYPVHPYGTPGLAATREVLEGIVGAQAAAQPFVYPTGHDRKTGCARAGLIQGVCSFL